jgi:hypothetical protein
MKNLTNTVRYLATKRKNYYGGAALIALVSTTSLSYAMDCPDVVDEIPRIRCLWNLEERNFRESALEILEKKVLNGPAQTNFKMRINYLKKLGEFLKENHQHTLNLEKWQPKSETEETPLSKFYHETLRYIAQSTDPAEKGLQTLKTKIFYSRLPQGLTQVNMEELKLDINKSFTSLPHTAGLNRDTLRYIKQWYFEEQANKKILQNLATDAEAPLLRGKVNCKLGLDIVGNEEICAISSREAFFATAAKTPYSLANYYLAELYNSESSKVASLYLPESAFEYYERAVNGGSNIRSYPLAAYKLSKFFEKGDDGFYLDPDPELALKYLTGAAENGHPYAQYELAKHFLENQRCKEGIELLKQSAESGYLKAQLDLAQKYEEGFGDFLKKDAQLALFWYHKAADQVEGDAAHYPLGYAYEIGKDYEKSIGFYEKSLDPRAHVRLGRMYLKGIGKEKSELLARDHFKKAVFQDNADGNYYLGLMKLRGQGMDAPNPHDAFNHFTAAAKQNHSKALFRLGIMQQFGVGTPQNHEEAKTSYEKSGIAAARYYLGDLYKRGLGGETNINQALKSWESPANAGHTESAYRVGKFYLNTGIDKQDGDLLAKAQLYLGKAGPQHKDALYLLGLMQEKGIGSQQNPIEAMKLYTGAAEAGDASAQFKLGKFYEMTLEPKDKDLAIRYYKLAAQQSHVDALRALIVLYRTGKGTPKNLNEADSYLNSLDKEISPFVFKEKKELLREGHEAALGWFEEKAKDGNVHAQYFLGKLLETGTHLPQNLPKAIAFYKEAAKQGKSSAQRRLDELKKAHLFEALGVDPNMK